MSMRTCLATLMFLLTTTPSAIAQTYSLREAPTAGECFRYQLVMRLLGEQKIQKESKPAGIPIKAEASQEFVERVLAVGPDGQVKKAARDYDNAIVTIRFGKDSSDRVLRPDRRLLIAQRLREQTLVYSPAGPLTREELQLTSEHLDTLSLSGLLPEKPVAVGDSWKIGPATIQALCFFEGLTAHDVQAKLESVDADEARILVVGTAAGIDTGALVKATINAALRFDLKEKRLAAIEWNQKDDREQGPASPAVTLDSQTVLKRKLVEQPNSLSDLALVRTPDGMEAPPALFTHLSHRDAKGRYEMLYGREWQIVGQTSDHLVLRLMERGDFIAQATVTPWASVKAGEHMSPEDFRQQMAQTEGWEVDQEVQAGEIPLEGGCWGYRLSTIGRLEGLKVTQNFYLVAGPGGEQIVVTFTMNPMQVEKLGTRDLSLVSSLQLPKAEGAKEKKD